ncbi:MAG: DUF362 domain-containing protein [Bacteroidales bacterium]|nr:DUF362 domain-containing protein [Bacteroidales bacterium]MCL2738733.1 DUF362 domain-containing protein [Bacteroidales bacterium]
MSTVYFTNLRTKPGNNLQQKMLRLIKAAGIEQIDFAHKFTAVKLHFGEPGNLAYIRHNYVQTFVRFLQEKEAKVFLTDANTLYSGGRSNAVDHIQSAFENGFNPIGVPAPVIIADGIKGTDEIAMPVVSSVPTHCQIAKIGSAVANADIIISMSHFKGHEQTGFGGALKNLGMGAASVGGKLELHSTSAPRIYRKNCSGCKMCVKYCRHQAISLDHEQIAVIDKAKCVGCGQCIAVCQFDAAQVVWDSSSELLCAKIAEYTKAIVEGKPHFHISFIMDVSPMCDCWSNNDVAIVPNIGMAASWDPVALDQACADLVTKASAQTGCLLNEDGGHPCTGEDKFRHIFPKVDWEAGLDHAQKIGLGSRKYLLKEI